MKRKVLFALLCLGVGSALAIAASIPEPVRILSLAEKDNVIAGSCFYDCDQWCTDSGACVGGGWCQGRPIGYLCGGLNDYVAEKCDVGNMLDEEGNCQTPITQPCMDLLPCTCKGPTTCNYNPLSDTKYSVSWAFSHLDCTGYWVRP
jgi:hypothetical protein